MTNLYKQNSMKRISITPFLKARLVFTMVSLDIVSGTRFVGELNASYLKTDASAIFGVVRNSQDLCSYHCTRISRVIYHLSDCRLSLDFTIDEHLFFNRLSDYMKLDEDLKFNLRQIFKMGYNNLAYAISLISSLTSQFE